MGNKFEDKIQSLIEERTIAAIKKQVSQKLQSIARNLGKPILSQNYMHSKMNNVDDMDHELNMIYDPIQIDEMADWHVTENGYYFDGLKYGVNLSIIALIYEDKLFELKATYNGYLVFAEIDGILKAYAPFPLWENAMEMFYEGSSQREKKRIAKEREEKKEMNKKRMQSFWEKFRHSWGF